MYVQRLALIDIGDSHRFEKSRQAASWSIQCLASRETRPRWGHVREGTSRDAEEILQYVMYPTRLMHIMAHGEKSGSLSPDQRLPFWPFLKRFELDALQTHCEATGSLPDIECLLLDACSSNTASWRTGLSRLVPQGKSMILIGTRRSVTWPDATTYTTNFYSVLLAQEWARDRGTFQKQVLTAHERANGAFFALHRRPSLFRANVIDGTA